MEKEDSSSIYDVAKKAGVSIATVSRVINGLDKVKDSRKEAVENAIKELNYVPSESARRLAGNKSGMIGVVMPFDSLEGSYIVEFLKGAVRRLDETEYSMVLINDHNYGKEEKEPAFLNYINKRSIDAILFSVVAPEYKKEWLKKAIVKNLPVAYVSAPISEFEEFKSVYSVYNRREDLLYDAIERFYLSGHLEIGMFLFEGRQHREYLDDASSRFAMKYGTSINIHAVEVKIESLDNISPKVLDEMIEVIKQYKCTGVFTLSTSLSKAMIRRLRLENMTVPDNISMMSIQWENDGSDDSNYNVDSISISVNDLGFYGMDMLVRSLKEEKDLANHMPLKYKLINKGSVKTIK